MFKVAVNVDVTTSQCERLSTVLNRLNNYLCGSMEKDDWPEWLDVC